MNEAQESDCILVIGSNTTENHPIIGQRIKRAVRTAGTKLIVADPRAIELSDYAHLWLRQKPGTDLALINGLLHVIVAEELYDAKFIEERTEGFEDVKKAVAPYTPERVEEITGVPAEVITKAARLFARGPRSAIYYAMGITQHVLGTHNVMGLANLAMACGHIGKPGTGVNPLRGQNNVQGACDMGGLPNVYPGYQPVTSEEARRKFEAAWGVKLSPTPGLTVVEMMNAVHDGRIKGIYLIGENPVLTDPDAKHVEEALRHLEFFVVQDIFLTETARYADVVLPAAGFGEKEGTFTNTERRVQKLNRAVLPPGQARQDWQIVQDLANRMGYPMSYFSPADIMEEVAKVTPSYGGITYHRLGDMGLQWPCPTTEHHGTRILHTQAFTRGKGKFHALEFQPAAETPDEEFSVILTSGRLHYHYHATISRRSKGLEEICPEPFVEINPADAGRLGIVDGQMVKLISRHGEVQVKAEVTPRVAPGVVFLSFHFAEARVNELIGANLDPIAKIPEYKAGAVKVSKA